MEEDDKFVFVISYKHEGHCSYAYYLVSCGYVCVFVWFVLIFVYSKVFSFSYPLIFYTVLLEANFTI